MHEKNGISISTTYSAKSNIFLDKRLEQITDYINNRRIVILTDRNVYRYYKDRFPPGDLIVLPTGERTKSFRTLQKISKKLLKLGVDRSTFILGIGGGVISDITGFVATIYMRGCTFGFVSTTLLSQIDASIGGKNGINFNGNKNIIGTFAQPQLVLCDVNMLATLPEREFINGLGEMIKYAIITDRNLFKYLEDHHKKILKRDRKHLKHIILQANKIKASIVKQDEREADRRRILNLGHTIGHAIESTTGLLHGEAIAMGIKVTADISKRLGMLHKSDYQRIITLLNEYRLSRKIKMNPRKLMKKISADKKRESSNIHYVFIERIGKPVIKPVTLKDLEEYISDL